ncbi:MAG: hypothetical protein JXQ72_11630 [Anaerolineae bacterium]|nr:hypothetical protein [Anaerolineae bacterium]
MRQSRRVFWAVIILGVLGVAAAVALIQFLSGADGPAAISTPWSAVNVNPDARLLTLQADPSFDRELLPPLMREQYDRLWYALENERREPSLDFYLAVGDVYWTARAADFGITALSMALRATGDPVLVEEVYRLFEIMRGALKDTNDDGYLNLTLQTGCDSTGEVDAYCGTDYKAVEETLLFGSLAHWTYVLWVNRALDPRYADAADFGLMYLEDHLLAKWQERNPNVPDYQWLDKSLYHCYGGVMRGYYYLYRMTGQQGYLDEALRRADVLLSGMEPDGQAWVFDHRVPNTQELLYPHPTTYATHTFTMWADLALEQFGPFTDDYNMSRWAATLRDNVLASVDIEASTMPRYVNGGGKGDESVDKFLITASAALALWDNTGQIIERSLQVQTGRDSNRRRWTISGALTLVYAVQEGYAARVPSLNKDANSPAGDSLAP